MAAHKNFLLLFAAALILCATICEAITTQDIWTKELKESYRVCRGRLPDAIDAEDLKWVITRPNLYLKYSDQVTFLRGLRMFSGGPESKEPMSKVRCLFESPCITAQLHGLNSTLTACNGVSIYFDFQPKANGELQVTNMYADGTPSFTTLSIPALTDRKSFIVYIMCYEDGMLGFIVYTTRPALSAYTRHVLRQFLDNSGFQDNFRIVTNFMSSTCKIRL